MTGNFTWPSGDTAPKGFSTRDALDAQQQIIDMQVAMKVAETEAQMRGVMLSYRSLYGPSWGDDNPRQELARLAREDRQRYPHAYALIDFCDEMIEMCEEALAFNPVPRLAQVAHQAQPLQGEDQQH